MTLSGRCQPPATNASSICSEERLRLEPQPQERQAEDPVAGDDERVLAQGVADDVGGPRMVDPVDLDHQTELVPVEVEVVAVRLVAPQHLTRRQGQPASPQLAYDVELTERARTVKEVPRCAPAVGAGPA
jgi:hypothetical protein